MKRIFDLIFSFLGLLILLPIIIITLILVFLQDYKNPFYISERVGRRGVIFKLFKIRSMKINDNRLKIDTTSANDPRITPLGKFIRNYKLDELPQLINVLLGDMSVVGPRPNVAREVCSYTIREQQLLSVRPGLSDFASVIFSNLGDIMSDHADPNLAYNQLIRPWKGRLGCLYVNNIKLKYDLIVIIATLLALFNRGLSISLIAFCLRDLNVEDDFKDILIAPKKLIPLPPFGSNEIVLNREV